MRVAHLFSLVVLVGIILLVESQEPHKFFPDEVIMDQECRTLQKSPQFCFNGIHFPTFGDGDVIEIYHMLTNDIRRENKESPQHAGIGIRNVNTSSNYTLHTYPLLPFAYIEPIQKDGGLSWCNQAASCLQKNFGKRFMEEHSERNLVATTTGQLFNVFARWVLRLNSTTTEFDVFNAWQSEDGPAWTDGWDCGGFARLCFRAMYKFGVRFVKDFTPKYWLLAIYTEKPVLLGNDTAIFGPRGNKIVANELLNFYKQHGPFLPIYKEYTYLYFNRAYWRARLSTTGNGLDLRTKLVPLPGN